MGCGSWTNLTVDKGTGAGKFVTTPAPFPFDPTGSRQTYSISGITTTHNTPNCPNSYILSSSKDIISLASSSLIVSGSTVSVPVTLDTTYEVYVVMKLGMPATESTRPIQDMVTLEVRCLQPEVIQPNTFIRSYIHDYDLMKDHVLYDFDSFTCQTNCINSPCRIVDHKLFTKHKIELK